MTELKLKEAGIDLYVINKDLRKESYKFLGHRFYI